MKGHKSFFSFLLGKDLPSKKVYMEDEKLLVDEKGNISINYSNPKVLQGIKVRMQEFENIPLAHDIKTDVGVA